MAGAETLGAVKADSVLAREMINRLQQTDHRAIVEFPVQWTDFQHGNLMHALGAKSFNLRWHQDRVNLNDEAFYYCSTQSNGELGERELREEVKLQEEGEDNGALYTGEWCKDKEIR